MSTVLVLNADFGLLGVVSARRAAHLLMDGRVVPETGVELAAVFRSSSTVIEVPQVVRRRTYIYVPHPATRLRKWSKFGVLQRDGYVCAYCGVQLNGVTATVDHIKPQWLSAKDGTEPDTWENTVCSCVRCQKLKGGSTLKEFLSRYKRIYDLHAPHPTAPKARRMIRHEGVIPASWRVYGAF